MASNQRPESFQNLKPLINNYKPLQVEGEGGKKKPDTKSIVFQLENLFDLFVADGLMIEKNGQYTTSNNFTSKSELTVHLGKYDKDTFQDKKHVGNQLTIVFSTNGRNGQTKRSTTDPDNGLNFGQLSPPN